jgi:hypothetical protein
VIVLLDTHDDLTVASEELGTPVEQLLTPLTRYLPQDTSQRFAIDNGGFSGFDAKAFVSLLEREEERISLCRWVAMPDIVGSAIRTLEAFDHWADKLPRWPKALVAQDGQESLPIPWSRISAVFIGGSTEWKLSKAASHIIRTAKIVGTWCHVGRVNTPGRFEYFEELGADSIDGTGLSRYTWMRKAINDARTTPRLAFGE